MKPSVISRLFRALSADRVERRFTDAIGTTLLENSSVSRFTHPIYWTVAPPYFRLRYSGDVRRYDAPLDPFKLEYVNPERITRISVERHRANRRSLFGSVKGGAWDEEGGPTGADDPNLRLYSGERFEETTIHRSMVAHFVDDVPWEETKFYDLALQVADRNEDRWHDCTSEERIRRRCSELDELYETMSRVGCLTQRELHCESDRRFLTLAGDEILVDVARDGELLFVDGRHRLSIAKILDLDRIPVLFLVRHELWMDHRDRLYGDDVIPDHPDLRDLKRPNAGYQTSFVRV